MAAFGFNRTCELYNYQVCVSWYDFTSAISKPPGIFLEWADIISVSEWVWVSEWESEWVSELAMFLLGKWLWY